MRKPTDFPNLQDVLSKEPPISTFSELLVTGRQGRQ